MAHEDLSWMELALCRQVGTGEEWFPEKGESIAAAKAICRRCPACVTCGEHALTKGYDVGVWGALSGEDRRLILRDRKQAAA